MANLSPEPSQRPNLSERVSQLMQSPALWVGGGIALALGLGSYLGLRYWVYHQLPAALETQLGQFLQRPVEIGKVESFSLGGIRLGSASIPATARDRDRLSFKSITLGLNPLPLLLGQPLALTVELDSPQVFLDQDPSGQWVNIELPKGKAQELPFAIDAQWRIKKADIVLKPYIAPKNMALTADGHGEYRYRSANRQWVSYDLDATALNSAIALKGHTTIETGASQIELQVKQVSLGEIGAFFANSAIKPQKGMVNANLNANVPSLAQIEQSQGQGNLSLQGTETKIAPLKLPLKLSLDLNLQGQTLVVQQMQACMGKISAQAQGWVNRQKGYDLQVTLNPLDLRELPQTFLFDYPFPIKGEAGAKMRILGKITDPTLTGIIQNSQPLQIDRTLIKRVQLTLQADLNQISLYNVLIQPTVGGEIIGQGRLQTDWQRSSEAHKVIDWLKMPIVFDFKGQLPAQPLMAPYYRSANQVKLGAIAAQGKITGSFAQPRADVQWKSADLATLAQETLAGSGTLQYASQRLLVKDTVLTTAGGQVSLAGIGDFKTQQGKAQLFANSFPLSPLIPVICSFTPCSTGLTRSAIALNAADLRLQGPINHFRLDRIKGIAKLNLGVNEGTAAIQTSLNQGNIQGQVVASGFNLNPYFSQLSVPVSLRRSQLSFGGSIARLLARKSFDARGLNADLDAELSVANQPLWARGQVRDGQLKAIANLKDLPLRSVFGALPVADPIQNALIQNAHLQNAQVQLSGDVQALLAALGTKQPDLRLLQVEAQGAIAIPSGRITAQASLAQNRWQAEILTRNFQVNSLLRSLKSVPSAIALAPMAAQLRLSGGVEDWFKPGARVSVVVDQLAIASGRQDLQAQGRMLLTSPFQALDIRQVNLQVEAQGQLADLPLNQLLALVPVRQDFLPEQIQLTGEGRFQGRFLAHNLISAPTAPGNLQLRGKVNLNDLVFNQRVFEPRLTGTLDATLGKTLALNLRGSEDILAATLLPCRRSQCSVPYIPASFELRQTYGNLRPLIAQAQLQGDRLVGRIEQFPLALLRLSPGQAYGILGNLQGEVNSEFAIDPYSLQGEGTLTLQNPRLGAIAAQAFNAKIAYRNAIARLDEATLQIGNSFYQVDGAVNLRNGALQANLAVNQGHVQDILKAFNISDVNSLIALLQFRPQTFSPASVVIPTPLGSPDATLAELLNLLAQIDQKIKARAQQLAKGGLPTALDIRGIFDAKVSLGGTIRQPTAQFQFSGNQWEWHPQPPFPNIIPPLGLVMTDSPMIPLNQLAVKGSLEKGLLTIDPAYLQVREAKLTLAGQLSLRDQKLLGTFRLDKLDFDTIGSWVKLPLDISGQINLLGQVSGNLKNPQVAGTFGFVEGALNARSLQLDLLGKFNYADQRFTLATTQPAAIAAYASIPLPPTPQNREADLQLRLNTDSLQLINILTQDQLTWLGGEGSLAFDAKAQFDPHKVFSFKAIANGKLILKDAVIKSAALPQPLTVNGEATLTQKGLQVDQLLGQFDQSQLLISGFLPLFAPPSPVPNPLTLTIKKGRINLENLYAGEIDGQVIVRGNSFNPKIGGGVQLANGEVFLPQSQRAENQIISTISRWSKPLQKESGVHLELDQFQVALRNLAIEQLPLYRFEFGGDLVLNGDLANLQNLQPQGEIAIALGRISFLDTRFLIDRRQRNQITFTPSRGLLNPDLDITMRTLVSDLPNSQRLRSDNSNEIPIDSITKIQRVDIGLNIKGPLSQLLPNLNANADQNCLRKNAAVVVQTKVPFSEPELTRLTRCLQILVAQDPADEQIFNNPAIRLTSNPSRSQGEIIRLLGQQLLVLADSLQGKNTEQLIQVGIVQLALPMVFQGVVYDIENAISNTVGSTDFRVVPFLEAVYRVDKDGFVRMGYDYSSNEVRVQYEKRF